MAQFPLVVVVALDICSSAHGAASATAIDYVEAHNRARAPVGVGPLKWSKSLATAATRVVIYQRDNNRCDLAAEPNSLTGSDPKTRTAMLRMALENWVEEKQYYDHDNNSCAPNDRSYTQVVWRKSLELGCVEATSVKEQRSVTVCFYNPPGNFEGETHPYLEPHNKARAVVDVVGPLNWNESMANVATKVATRPSGSEDPRSLNGSRSNYNSNQFWLVVRSRPVTSRLAMESWVSEKQYYNSCVQSHGRGSYTQVVWRNSSKLWCAEAMCKLPMLRGLRRQAPTLQPENTSKFTTKPGQPWPVGVEPLKWIESLANATSRLVRYQKINQACNFAILTSGSKYGANQLWASGQSVSPTMVVDTWVKEKDFYNHSGNSCAKAQAWCVHPGGVEEVFEAWVCSGYLCERTEQLKYLLNTAASL
ncbi:unnamed protein product [Malus baccata var. baccata]